MTTLLSVATATAGVFRPLTGEPFWITLPTGERVKGTLAEVSELPGSLPDRRAPFSLIFHLPLGPAAPLPVQGTLIVEHPASGRLEVFAVSLLPGRDVARWQVVFG
jgi:hypothetical protein